MFRVLACVVEEHDFRLVILAAVICAVAAFASFRIFALAIAGRHVRYNPHRRLLWLGLTGISTGAGIWSTHFVAMLAYKSELPTAYDPVLTLTSILIAIGVTTLGYAIAASRDRRPAAGYRFDTSHLVDRKDVRAAAGGGVIGAGIGFMHYTGMSAVIIPGTFTWDIPYVTASVVLGCVLAAAALVASRRLNARWAFWIAPGLLTLAICSLHFTAMAAATVIPDPTIVVQPSVINTLGMAFAVAGSTILIMLATVGSALVNSQVERDQHLQLLEAQRLGKIGDWRYVFGSEIWVGPQVYNLLGYKPRAARPSRKAILSVYRGDGARRVIEAQAEVARSREVKTVDVKFRRGDGSLGDFAVTSKALTNSGGEVIGFAGTIQDISERKSAPKSS